MIRVAILTPILAMRAGLRALLTGSHRITPDEDTEIQVVFEAASLDDFEAYAPTVDILLMMTNQGSDADLSVVKSQVQLRRLAEAMPEDVGRLALLLLTDQPQVVYSLAGLPLRAWGVLTVDASPGELQAAVRGLYGGLLVSAPALLEPVLARQVVQPLISLAGDEDDIDEGRINTTLTERESQVLQLLAHGLANKQIAAQLNISEHTVKFHISSIYTKLGVTNRAEAVRIGVKYGLILL